MKLKDRVGDVVFIPSSYVPGRKSRVLLTRRRRMNIGVKLTVSATNFSDSSDFLVNPDSKEQVFSSVLVFYTLCQFLNKKLKKEKKLKEKEEKEIC